MPSVSVSSPIDDLVPLVDVAANVDMKPQAVVSALKRSGIWKDVNTLSLFPPIFAETAVYFLADELPVTDDPEWPAIEDPGAPAPVDHPYYVIGDAEREDFVLV